ncbi:MAG: flagellar basal body P-ring formation protein FlgA, partial [Gammaproteobacteria bacterium]|nr:flagellar basal body P-ring formation protein FlgA [Gammaproteobacteria bacterium]
TLGVRCDDDKPWSLNLPITVTIYKDIVVTADALPRGKILTENDFRHVSYDVSKLPAGYIEDDRGIGMELKRRLSRGVPLTINMLRKPIIIKRGQQVSIIATTGRMEVRMPGKALAHGAAGDRIRVMNLKSKKKVEGTVTPSGNIRVDI